MKQITFVAFCLLMASSLLAEEPRKPPSPAEVEYRAAVQKAQRDYDAKLGAAKLQREKAIWDARQAAVPKLSAEMIAATKRGDLDSANRIKAQLDALKNFLRVVRLDAQGNRRVNLLACVDLKKDAVGGEWQMNRDGLVSPKGQVGVMQFPYRPSTEYDYRISFRRLEGEDSIYQVFPAARSSCAWIVGGWGNNVCGIQWVDGAEANGNSTTTKREHYVPMGSLHTTVVKVRKDSIRGFLDDVQLAEVATIRLTANDLGMRDASCLGLRVWNSVVAFESIEVVEVAGEGKLLRIGVEE